MWIIGPALVCSRTHSSVPSVSLVVSNEYSVSIIITMCWHTLLTVGNIMLCLAPISLCVLPHLGIAGILLDREMIVKAAIWMKDLVVQLVVWDTTLPWPMVVRGIHLATCMWTIASA